MYCVCTGLLLANEWLTCSQLLCIKCSSLFIVNMPQAFQSAHKKLRDAGNSFSRVLDLCLISAASTAEVERGVSLAGNILTEHRSRMLANLLNWCAQACICIRDYIPKAIPKEVKEVGRTGCRYIVGSVVL